MGLTVVAARLAERFPHIVFQLVNLGGTLPFVVERMEAVALSREPYEAFPRQALRGMFYDCASLGPLALAHAVRVLGADRIMLGTDYPIFSADPVRDTVEAAQIEDSDRRRILQGTASGASRTHLRVTLPGARYPGNQRGGRVPHLFTRTNRDPLI